MVRNGYYVLCAFVLFLGVCRAHNESQVPPSLLQEDFKKALSQLDQLAGNLQYLGQVVNTSQSFNSDQKIAVRLWIIDLIADIKNFKAQSNAPHEQSLLTLLQNTKVLSHLVVRALENKLAILEPFEPPCVEDIEPHAFTQEEREAFNKRIGIYLNGNGALISSIEQKTSVVGLTQMNIVARKLDDLNVKYNVTSTLEQLPKYLGLGALALYLTPYESVKNIPVISWLKRKIGTSEYWDREGEHEINYYGEKRVPKLKKLRNSDGSPKIEKKTLAKFVKSNDRKSLAAIAATAAFLYKSDYIAEYFEPVKKYIRNYWNKIKGFSIGKVGTFMHPEITLDDPKLIGLESQIAQMQKIVQYITEPEKYDRSACGLEKGILLTGPSRSGKTLLANALCGSLNEKLQEKGMIKKFAFKEITWSDIILKKDDGIKSIVEEAKQNAPCVLFIDELHNLPLQTKEGGQTLSQFLTMADSLKSTGLGDAVIILAATNRAYALDDALLKPGRFGLQIHFENPSFEHRKKFFTIMCQNNALEAGDFDMKSIASQTENCSYGDLDLVFKTARFAAHNQGRQLRQEDFQRAIDIEVCHLRFDDVLPLTDHARKVIAAHQAGHAFMLVTHETETDERLETVTIRGKWRKIKETRWFDPKSLQMHLEKKTSYGHVYTSHVSEAVAVSENLLLQAKIKLSGALAEKVLLGSTSYTYHPNDKRKALILLEKITMKGLGEESFSKEELIEPKQQAKKLLEQCEKEVTQLLMTNKGALNKLANTLNERMLLRHDEVKKILANPNN